MSRVSASRSGTTLNVASRVNGGRGAKAQAVPCQLFPTSTTSRPSARTAFDAGDDEPAVIGGASSFRQPTPDAATTRYAAMLAEANARVTVAMWTPRELTDRTGWQVSASEHT